MTTRRRIARCSVRRTLLPWRTIACALITAVSTATGCDPIFGFRELFSNGSADAGAGAADTGMASTPEASAVPAGGPDGTLDSPGPPPDVGQALDATTDGAAFVDSGPNGDGASGDADASTDAAAESVDDAECSEAGCEPIMLAPAYYVQGLASDGTSLYWVDSVQGLVFSCPITGCEDNPPLFAFDPTGGYPQVLLISGDTVYWASYGSPAPGSALPGAIVSCPLSGCGYQANVVAQGQGGPWSFVADATNLYWTDQASGEVMMCAAADCNPAPLATGRAILGGLYAIAVYSTTLYWADDAGIVSCPIAGCNNEPAVLVPDSQVFTLAVDQNNLYWTAPNAQMSGAGMIMSCPIHGCDGGPTVLASNQATPEGLVIDETNVYWVNTFGGQVMRCSIQGCGGMPTVLATNQSGPDRMAIDATHIFWATNGSSGVGAIMALPK